MFIGCPKIKTVQANEIFILSLIEIAFLLQSDLLFPWDRVLIEINYVVTTTNDDDFIIPNIPSILLSKMYGQLDRT